MSVNSKLAYVLEVYLFLLYMHGYFAYVNVYVPDTCIPPISGGQKSALDPLGLELQMTVSSGIGAGNQTHVF